MGPRASRNRVTVVPLGHSRFTSRRVSSGMGSKPGDFSDMGHLVSGSKMGGHLPPNGYTLSLSIPDGTRQLVRTEFPNRVIYEFIRRSPTIQLSLNFGILSILAIVFCAGGFRLAIDSLKESSRWRYFRFGGSLALSAGAMLFEYWIVRIVFRSEERR